MIPSPLEHYFSWLLEATWQASVLALAVMATQWLLGARLTARWRYALWMLVLARLLAPQLPASPLSMHRLTAPPQIVRQWEDPAGATEAAPRPPLPATKTLAEAQKAGPAEAAEEPHAAWRPGQIAALVWLGGAAMAAGYFWAMNLLFLKKLRPTGETDETILALLGSCAAEMGVRRPVGMAATALIDAPAIMGLWRPRLLMPAGYARKFSREELRHIFLHEMAHVKRGDVAVNWLMAAAQCLHWFNPLAWLALARMRADREAATDACVLERQTERERGAYGAMLLALAQGLNRPQGPQGAVGILEGKSALRRRIEGIANFTKGSNGWSLVGCGCVLALGIAGLTGAQAEQPAKAAEAGSQPASYEPAATPEQAEEWEKQVKANPEDLATRDKLVGYYSDLFLNLLLKNPLPEGEDKKRLEEAADKGLAQAIWIVQRVPDKLPPQTQTEVGFFFNPAIDYQSRMASYKALWLKEVQEHPGNAAVIKNAMDPFFSVDPDLVDSLIKQGRAIAPQDPDWDRSQKINKDSRKAKEEREAEMKKARDEIAVTIQKDTEEAAAQAGKRARELRDRYESAEAKLAGVKDAETRFAWLPDAAKAAWAVGEDAKAQAYAEEMLREAPQYQSTWAYGNAIYTGHDILGRIALKHGETEEAKRELLAAGTTPGSPQLDTFGPDLTLAGELVKAGEERAVLRFLDAIAKFWKSERDNISGWKERIEQGRWTIAYGKVQDPDEETLREQSEKALSRSPGGAPAAQP